MRFAKLFMPLLAVMLVCSSAAFAAEEPVLAVDGRGSASIAPDQAVVTVGVVSRARSASQAQAENAQKSIAITQALKQLGVAGSDIKSQNFSFQPDYRTDDRKHAISGYTASHYLQINVRDIAKAGKIVDTALQSGANEVHSLRFSVSNQSAVRKEALGKAINDARNKADIIAQGLGCRIIGIKSVSESTGSIESRSYSMNMLAAAKAVDTSFEPGMLTLDANVHIEYLLSRAM
jgi:uncharacterized protein YggE